MPADIPGPGPVTPGGGAARGQGDTRSARRRAGLKRNGGASGGTPDKRFGMGRRTRRVVYAVLGFIAVCILVVGGLVAYAAATLPNIDDIGKATGTIKILDRNGQLIAEVGHDAQTRTSVPIDKISPIMQSAMLSAEDRNFYNEGAFDLKRIAKAIVDDLILRRPAEGASTITQQLVKQAFFGQVASRDPLRKIREALLAQQIDSKWSKSQILDEYLNITYFGENAYGIENAAERYFGKHASELNLAEASLLAGLPEAPSYNDPFKNPQAAYGRMQYVLQGLVDLGKITQAQAQAVDPLVGGSSPDATEAAMQQHNQQVIQADLLNGKSSVTGGAAPHFVQYVQDQLQAQFQADPAFLNGSLVVTTTLDLSIQQKAMSAVHDGIARLGRGANNGALLMIDAHTGGILAMVGSADFTDDSIAGQFNVVTAQRQPGSSFKPFVYETGFMNGSLTPQTMLNDTRPESQQLGGVQDFDRGYQGQITAAHALLYSRNIATEQAMQTAGVNNVINFAHSAGITTDLAPNLSTAIGTSAVKMIDLASAYAPFANGGHKVTAYGILKVVDGSGNVLADNSQAPNQGDVMTAAQAWSITNILKNYAHVWNLAFKWPTAGKSGTTDSFIDAWYNVYTPDWVVSTWAGHTDGSNPAEVPMNQVFGVTEAQYIAVPFVNSLPKPSPFVPVNGGPSDCSTADASFLPTSTSCPTPSPTATPVPTPTPTAQSTPTPGSTPRICPSPTPGGTPGPIICPSPSAGGAQGQPSAAPAVEPNAGSP